MEGFNFYEIFDKFDETTVSTERLQIMMNVKNIQWFPVIKEFHEDDDDFGVAIVYIDEQPDGTLHWEWDLTFEVIGTEDEYFDTLLFYYKHRYKTLDQLRTLLFVN